MKRILVLAVTVCAVASQSLAGIVWSESFDQPGGTSLATIGSPWGGGQAGFYTVGAANPLLVMRAHHPSGLWSFVDNAQTATSLATLSIDLGSDATFSGNSYLRLAISAASGNVKLIDFNGGGNHESVVTGGMDHFDIIANNTGTAQAIENLGGTIAANTLTVYKNGSASSSFTINADTDGFGLWMNGGGDTVAAPMEVMYGDEMVWRNNAYAIPEPGTLGLIAAFSTGILFIRRRFMI